MPKLRDYRKTLGRSGRVSIFFLSVLQYQVVDHAVTLHPLHLAFNQASNNSLDRSGGSVFRIKPGAPKVE
jgi:hypothetical protein